MKRAILVCAIVLLMSLSAEAAWDMTMDLDFYNKFDKAVDGSPGDSFARYHLANLTYSRERWDANLMYDWFDWTHGEENKHVLTPWAAWVRYHLNDRETIEAGHWIVSDIVSDPPEPVALTETRLTYKRDIPLAYGADLSASVGVGSGEGGDGVKLTGSVEVGRRFGPATVAVGVNNISVLDQMLYSAGRVPVTAGVTVPWSRACSMHAVLIKMVGPEPDSMPSQWIYNTPLIARLGWEFKMF